MLSFLHAFPATDLVGDGRRLAAVAGGQDVGAGRCSGARRLRKRRAGLPGATGGGVEGAGEPRVATKSDNGRYAMSSAAKTLLAFCYVHLIKHQRVKHLARHSPLLQEYVKQVLLDTILALQFF